MLFALKNNYSSNQQRPSSWAWFFVLCLSISATGCVAPFAAIGASGSAAASSVGTAAGSAAAAYPMTAASLATTAATGKSPLEHAASAATKKDCSFLNAFGSKPICEDVPVPTIKDLSEPYPGPADAPDYAIESH